MSDIHFNGTLTVAQPTTDIEYVNVIDDLTFALNRMIAEAYGRNIRVDLDVMPAHIVGKSFPCTKLVTNSYLKLSPTKV